MELQPGQMVGAYSIVSPLGAGGMGEVYRAHDTRLRRDVALKILPRELTADASRKRRFEHECRTLAALNHPNIVAVYDVGENYFVSELVDGESLRGAHLPLRKAIDVAAQIADGLAAAHAAGITHRDLKPDNVMLSRDGRAKILDFGLAKDEPEKGPSDSTVTQHATEPGVVLGTVGYMSPEQVRAEATDHRSDIFSFGALLYELLAGKRAFQRATTAETMTAILNEEPPELPTGTPPQIRDIVLRCLEKEPRQRFQNAADLAFGLRSISTGATAPAATGGRKERRSRRILVWTAALAAAAIAGYVPARLLEEERPDPAKLRYRPFTSDPGPEITPRWSPKGDLIAYAGEAKGRFQIFVRKVDGSSTAQITDHPGDCFGPSWSPDGRKIYFSVREPSRFNSTWTIPLAGGDPVKILDNALYARVSPDGTRLVFLGQDENRRVGLWSSGPAGENAAPYPYPLIPQHRGLLGQLVFDFAGNGMSLAVISSREGPPTLELYRIQGLDVPPRKVLEAPMAESIEAFSSMVYLNDRDKALVSLRLGNELIEAGAGRSRVILRGDAPFTDLAASPDGRVLAFEKSKMDYDIWEIPTDGSGMRALVATEEDERSPTWAPDSSSFAYATSAELESGIWVQEFGKAERRAVVRGRDLPGIILDTSYSPDGKRIAFRRVFNAITTIWIAPLSGSGPVPLTKETEKGPQRGPAWSPDGKWIAYYGVQDGKPAIFKAKVGAETPPELVTLETAVRPVRWSPRGDWLACDTGPGIALVGPDGKKSKRLSERVWYDYGFSPDGTRLYGLRENENQHLILAWLDVETGAEKVVSDLGLCPVSFTRGYLRNEFPARGLSVSPDGKRILTSFFKETGNIYLLEGLFERRSWWQRLNPFSVR